MPDGSDCPRPAAFATEQVQGGYDSRARHRPAVAPIHQSNAFEFDSLSDARALFALERDGDIYSRAANPTVLVLEERVAALEGGIAAAGVASGQAAVAVALLALAGRGGHIVAAHQLYGGTVDLLTDTLPDWGIETTLVDQDDPEAWRAAVRPTTRAFFAESITNPIAQVLDVRTVARIAHAAGVPLVVDNTVATPALQRPGDHGADIVVHSATKFLGGHGTSLGGIVVDAGSFDFGDEPSRWPQFTQPYRRAPHGSLVERHGVGGSPFITLVKTKYVHDLGPSLSAFNAFQLLQGIETLDLRMARHSASAQAVAEHLAGHPAVVRVHHPGLTTSPWHERAREYLPRGLSSVFAFDLPATGDAERDFALVERVISRLRRVRLVANIGDARSLVAHPASMTHSHMSPQQFADAGISATTVRLSIGLEDPADIIADLDDALDVVLDGARDDALDSASDSASDGV